MERKIQINYNWDYELTDFQNLNSEIIKLLEEHAEERIYEMRKEGYTCGDLIFENDKITVCGWWSFSYV